MYGKTGRGERVDSHLRPLGGSVRGNGKYAISTGWASKIGLALTFGILPDSKLRGVPRLDHIKKQVLELLGEPELLGAEPGLLVVMEDFALHARSGSIDEICGMAYLVRHALWQVGIDYLLVTPNQLKKFVTGSGAAEKSKVMKEVLKRFEVDTEDDNQADAVVLAHIGAAMAGLWEPTLDAQRELLKDLLKQKRLSINN